ncbi:hypothetical protein J6590_054606 [Homalodisca vitripennis]|nr:hypothetical protein J6590_054606 [Homalodisca vitripennis]
MPTELHTQSTEVDLSAFARYVVSSGNYPWERPPPIVQARICQEILDWYVVNQRCGPDRTWTMTRSWFAVLTFFVSSDSDFYGHCVTVRACSRSEDHPSQSRRLRIPT